jgi:hypothetical protein
MNKIFDSKEIQAFYDYTTKLYSVDDLQAIIDDGCASGAASYHIYYKDTCADYEAHECAIWELACKRAEDEGYKNALELISTFCGADQVVSKTCFENLMCWYAIEEMARAYFDNKDNA